MAGQERIRSIDLPGPKEDDLHASLVEYLSRVLPKGALVHHSPNEGKRGWLAQNNIAKHGVLKGFPDLIILYAAHAYFIEIKTKKGRISTDQIRVLAQLNDQCFHCAIVRDLEGMRTTLIDFGLISGKAGG